MALTDKQKLFADEYLIDLNATRAYKAVYKNCKSEESAKAASSRLLTNVNLVEYVNKRMEERSKRTEITQDFVLQELYAIAKANGSQYAQVVDEPIIQNGQYVVDPDTGKVKTYKVVEIIPTNKLDEEQKKAIAGIKETKYGIDVSTYDKVKALELLGRHLGMFKDKVEVTGINEEKSKLDSIITQLRGG